VLRLTAEMLTVIDVFTQAKPKVRNFFLIASKLCLYRLAKFNIFLRRAYYTCNKQGLMPFPNFVARKQKRALKHFSFNCTAVKLAAPDFGMARAVPCQDKKMSKSDIKICFKKVAQICCSVIFMVNSSDTPIITYAKHSSNKKQWLSKTWILWKCASLRPGPALSRPAAGGGGWLPPNETSSLSPLYSTTFKVKNRTSVTTFKFWLALIRFFKAPPTQLEIPVRLGLSTGLSERLPNYIWATYQWTVVKRLADCFILVSPSPNFTKRWYAQWL